jgi:hypothetical protein
MVAEKGYDMLHKNHNSLSDPGWDDQLADNLEE